MITSTLILAAGSSFILWLGERITDKGIGNGVSFIIMVGIIARFPSAFMQELISRLSAQGASNGGLVMFLFEIVVLLLATAGTIMLVQGVRKVPVQYAKRIEGGRQIGGARQYIPLKVNAANVMPIIFAQAIMFIPIAIVGTGEQSGFWKVESEKVGLKLNIQKTKIMASGPITSWQIDGETIEIVTDFILGAPESLEMVTAAMKLKDAYSLEGKL